VSYGEFVAGKGDQLVFEQLPADHPVYILYFSLFFLGVFR
jgi:hypothetical protein